MKDLQEKINIVKEDIQKKFPGCNYTVTILLWDDDTDRVECKHGTPEKIHISTFYEGELSYREFNQNKNNRGMMLDDYGNEYHMR